MSPGGGSILDGFKLDGRVALVTGGGRGIGRASAIALSEAGADVVVASRRPEPLAEVMGQIEARGRRALAVPTDVRELGELDRVMERTLDTFGRLDVLVNNAGGYPPTIALAVADEDFEAAYRFNVTQVLHLSRLAAPHLGRAGGAIVNVSSSMSQLVDTGFVAYGAAKAALNHLTRLLAHEWAPHVRVNALAVGGTMTDALEAFAGMPELLAQMVARTPMGRLGQPEDIAAAVLYLASPASSWVTGTVMEIDGGAPASTWPYPMDGGLAERIKNGSG
jgi:7-alpha-hydroxysteroid dehydrogenase